MKKLLFVFTALSFLALTATMLPMAAGAAEVTLAWDANTETDLAGYNIYYDTDASGEPYDGTGIDQGDSRIPVPLADLDDPAAPTIKLTGLVDGTYRFAATAYDSNGNESGFSNEVEYTVDERAPDAPANLTAAYDPVAKTVSLAWQQGGSVPVDHWIVFFREAGATEWVELDSVEYSETPTLITPMTAVAEGEHKLIEWTVVAFRDSGQNSPDAEITSTDIDRQPPEPPVLTIQAVVPVI